jgi:hypothetical protein
MPFWIFYGCTRKRRPPVPGSTTREDEIDNVARRFELLQPIREPKFIGKRDRIVGHRNHLTPQGSNSRPAKCF